jgi:DNA-binding transcriptional regulator YhcF (GntR family)
MCVAGSWIDNMPEGTIIQSAPQESIRKLQQDVLPEYRRLAANLIDMFINEFEAQGGNRREITEKFESMYKWKK